jgi:LPXTG-motif cell wall-anchored protein
VVLAAACIFLMLSSIMLYFGFMQSPTLNLWVGGSILAALIGYFLTKKKAEAKVGQIPIPEEIAQ